MWAPNFLPSFHYTLILVHYLTQSNNLIKFVLILLILLFLQLNSKNIYISVAEAANLLTADRAVLRRKLRQKAVKRNSAGQWGHVVVCQIHVCLTGCLRFVQDAFDNHTRAFELKSVSHSKSWVSVLFVCVFKKACCSVLHLF